MLPYELSDNLVGLSAYISGGRINYVNSWIIVRIVGILKKTKNKGRDNYFNSLTIVRIVEIEKNVK